MDRRRWAASEGEVFRCAVIGTPSDEVRCLVKSRRADSGRVAPHRSAAPIEQIRQAAIDVHLPLIEEAGKRGVQILGLQEIFNGPYFCPSQDAHWYDIAEPVPGPTTELMAELREEIPDGDGRAGLRARAGRRLLQHRGGLRRRRHLSRQVPRRTTFRTPRGSGRSTSSSRATSAIRSSRPASPRSASTSATTATFPKARGCSG